MLHTHGHTVLDDQIAPTSVATTGRRPPPGHRRAVGPDGAV
jgi:hypothetical protein